ncbi:CHAP domain-containing protein [Candidatus Microgenomates bacterium]|nr:CHAP domain-containing protein [Candidatus Microgenomates bacterium]
MSKFNKIIVGLFVLSSLLVTPLAAYAQTAASLQAEIDRINAQIERDQTTLANISSEADTLANKLRAIEYEIATLEARIARANLQIADAKTQIKQAVADLAKTKQVMFENAKVLYKMGNPTTIEILASSDNFSEFINRQEYLESVKDAVNQAAAKIIALKEKLEAKQTELERYVSEQQIQKQFADTKRSEQAQLLAETQGQESRYQQIVQSKQAKVAELRAQQAAINLANQRNVSSGGCGGYPSIWCNAPMDSLVDDWGMYNRECVSYTAWKVWSSGRYMPYWGGRGNANQWDESAQADGIPTGYEPRVGAVAIRNAGEYGHSMYVESINDDGSIRVSQFNAGWDGNYSVADVDPAGLVFIYF